MVTGYEYDQLKAIESLAYNTKGIAEVLTAQNKLLLNIVETLREIDNTLKARTSS